MKKIRKEMTVLWFLWLLAACTKNTTNPVVPTPPQVVDSTTVQYGTPYSEVPDREDAVIYQVNIRAFSDAGNLEGVMARLDSIKAIGANVVYLMPIYPVGQVKAVNSPYAVKDYFTVNPEFGTLANLRNLVSQAHSKGLTVMLDFVANHTAWDNAWTSTHKDWYLQDASGTIVSPPNTGWNDVAQLNFNNQDLRKELIRSMKYWVYNANVDGFRFDYADGPPIDFWKQAIDSLRNIKSHELLLLAEGSRGNNFSAGFDYIFGFNFFGNLKNIYEKDAKATTLDSLDALEYTGSAATQRVVRYTTNHDVNSSDGTPEELFGGEAGALSAFVSAAFLKAVPMIYNGQEVGTPYRIVFPFTDKNVDWTLHPELKATYKQLLAVYNGNKTLRSGALQTYNTADVAAFTKTTGSDSWLVIDNVRNKASTYNLPATLQGKNWKNAITNTTQTIETSVDLQPYQYLVLQQQ